MARVAFAALLSLVALMFAVHARADEPEIDRAEALFREGNRAFAVGDYQSAFTLYREAWSLRKSFDIACNLGRTEAELGFARDAAEHLDDCLRTFSVSSKTEMKDANRRFRDLFNRVRADVGAIEVEARPAGTEISVDGVSYGVTPLGRQLFVDPGQRRVRARLHGYQEREVIVTVSAGGAASVRLDLARLQAAQASAPPAPVAASPAAPAVAARSSGMEPRTIVVLSGAALAVVGMGLGVGFTLDANAAAKRASELNEQLAGAGEACPSTDGSPDCMELRDAVDRENDSRDIAGAAFLGSAIASAATIGFWLVLPELKRPAATGLRFVPQISGAQGFGLTVAGDY